MLKKKGFIFLLYAGVFLLSLAIGWTITKCVGDTGGTTIINTRGTTKTGTVGTTKTGTRGTTKTGTGGTTKTDTGGTTKTDTGDTIIPSGNRINPVEILVVEKTLQNDNLYTLRVRAENIPERVTPVYKIESIKRISAEGYFKNIPGTPSEKYEVVVVDEATGIVLARKTIGGFKCIAPPPVIGMTAGEFQVLLLNLNDNSLLGGKNPKVAKNVGLTVRGMHDDEPTPGDIQAVRDKISNRIWVSARVISVGHDEKGRINSAVIQPVYN